MSVGRERVTRSLELLTLGLYPFVEREMKAVYRDRWHDASRSSFRKSLGVKGETIRWDAHALLTVMWDQWNAVFRHKLGTLERSLISELREYRNRWAHQEQFGFEDAYRILDSVERLLAVAGASEHRQVARDKRDLMRRELAQEAKNAHRRAQLRKRKLQDLAIYIICCSVTVFAILHAFGGQAWFLGLFVVATFAYIGWQRNESEPPVFYGAHECMTCSKIIYSDDCPYCERSGRVT